MSEACDEMRLLIQADLDGELRPAEAARVAAHLAGCPDCVRTQAELAGLSDRMAREASRYPASEAFRTALTARLAAAAPSTAPTVRRRQPLLLGASFGAGAALAASVLFLLMPIGGSSWPDEIVASHIRALQPGHLMDVVSTDQHTVKPWFDGRLPFAPPVKDLAAIGFPLAGGRLDYLAGRPAAAMIYHHGQHVIDLYAFDGTDLPAGLAPAGSRDGYNFERWTDGGMSFWAVSDLNAQELADFVRAWRKL
jgi:anti-sigma factor RsiW